MVIQGGISPVDRQAFRAGKPAFTSPDRVELDGGPGGRIGLSREVVAALTRSQKPGELTPLWNHPIPEVVGPGYPDVMGAPVMSRDGRFAFFASEKTLFALHNQTGETGWTFDAGGQGIRSRPLVGPDGTVFVPGGDGKIHALDPGKGKELRAFDAPPGQLGLGPDGALVVWHGAGLSAFDPATGTPRWSSPVGGPDAAPGLEGRVFRAGDGERTVVCYDRDSGKEAWRLPKGGLIRHRPTVGPDGTVYAGNTDGTFFALDPQTGAPKWDFAAQGYILYPATLSEDGATVFVGSSDHHVYALDTATGDERWRRDVGAEVRMQPGVPGDGTVVLASDRNVVFVLDEATGAVLGTAPAASYVHVTPAARNGAVVLQANNHALYGYQAPASVAQMVGQAGPDAPDPEIVLEEDLVRVGEMEVPIRLEMK